MNSLDYAKIRQRIRYYRKAKSLSQEQLAEAVGISVTHMSHIETGGTKLSLPVLVCLSRLLGVSADSILFDEKSHMTGEAEHIGEVAHMLEECNTAQADIILTLVKAAKVTLDKYRFPMP